MDKNLRTVFLGPNNELNIIDGWYVYTFGNLVYVDLLGVLTLDKCIDIGNISIKKDAPAFLYSASLFEVEAKEKTTPCSYNCYQEGETIRRYYTISPNRDNYIYYRFIMKEGNNNISFAPNVHILTRGKVEDPNHSEKYDELVYVSTKINEPLIIDSNNCVCISPFDFTL